MVSSYLSVHLAVQISSKLFHKSWNILNILIAPVHPIILLYFSEALMSHVVNEIKLSLKNNFSQNKIAHYIPLFQQFKIKIYEMHLLRNTFSWQQQDITWNLKQDFYR